MRNNEFRLFAQFQKVDEEKREVYGYASTEAMDSQGEIVKKDAIEKALPDYMKFGNIREMHQPSAVGKTKSAEIDDKGLFLKTKIVDDSAWAKVKEGVYNGFSIGGRILEKVGKEIRDLELVEISIVDRPANPEALFTVYKVDGRKAEMNGEESDDMRRGKIMQALNPNGEWNYYVIEMYSSSCIVQNCHDSKFYSVDFEIKGDDVTFGEMKEMKLEWTEKYLHGDGFQKYLGYTPWWIKKSNSNEQSMKKQDEAPKPEEKPVETPANAEAPVETPAAPETPEVKPEEKPVETPATPPAEEPDVEKRGAKISKENKAKLLAAMDIINELLGDDEEKGDQPGNLTKSDVNSIVVKLGSEISANVAKAIEPIREDLGKIEERLKKVEEQPVPVKPKASYLVGKAELSDEQKAAKAERIEALQKRINELADLKKSMSGNEYASKYGQEAEQIVTELRTLKMQ